MSAYRTDYLFYGSNVGCENIDYEEWEDEINGAEGAMFDVVYDGMSGNYAYVGKIIAAIHQHDGIDGKNPICISDLRPPEGLAPLVASAFPDASGFGFYMFSHYS